MNGVESWAALLIQVPLVGVFIWYSLTTQRAFMDALDKRDQAFERRNLAVIEAMDKLNTNVCVELGEIQIENQKHDRFVRENFAKRGAAK
jgi:hypothetical protein